MSKAPSERVFYGGLNSVGQYIVDKLLAGRLVDDHDGGYFSTSSDASTDKAIDRFLGV